MGSAGLRPVVIGRRFAVEPAPISPAASVRMRQSPAASDASAAARDYSKSGRRGAHRRRARRAPGARTRPAWRHGRAGVRTSRPCWMRNGSYTSSTVSVCSLTLMASVDRPTGPPPNCWHRAREDRPVDLVEAALVDAEHAPGRPGPSRRRCGRRRAPRRSRAPGAAGGWRCAACPASGGRSPTAPSSSMRTPRMPAARTHDGLELAGVVVVEAGDEAEAVAQRAGDQPRAGGGADQREPRQASGGWTRPRGPCRRRCRAGSPPSPGRGSPRRRGTGGGSRR